MDQTIPMFSVIIPTYNRGHILLPTISTILNQDLPDFELIVIDDGSTDNTAEVISEIKDPRFTYLKKENGERGAARNKGVQLARGKYINFIDSDDLVYNHHLRVAKEFLEEKNSPEIFHLAYDIKRPNGEMIRQVNGLPSPLNDALITGNHLSCNGVFIRRDIAESNPFHEDRRLAAAEDYELWLRMASRYEFLNHNEITTTVVDHDERSVVSTDKEKLITRVMLLLSLVDADGPCQSRFGPKLKIIRANLMAYIALHLAMTKRYRFETFKFLFLGISNHFGLLFTRRFLGVLKNLI